VLYQNILNFLSILVKTFKFWNIHNKYATGSFSGFGSSSSRVQTNFVVFFQPGSKGFVLVQPSQTTKARNVVGLFTWYPEFLGQGDEDIEQNWHLCKAI